MSDTNNTAQVVPFTYDDAAVRTIVIDGEPWFIARDICNALGLPNLSMALQRLAEDEKGVNRIDTLGGSQQMAIVSESGMYALVLRSDKPEAVTFRRWITSEVLPAIRKTGNYSTTPALTAPPLTGPELIATALIESQKMVEARDARIHQLEEKVTADAPKVGYIDQYVTDTDLLSFSTVASTNGVTEKALRELLLKKDWIYAQTDSRWSESKGCKVTRNRYSEKADKKRLFRRVETHEAPRFRGSEVMHTLKVTPAGAEAIARLVAKEAAA